MLMLLNADLSLVSMLSGIFMQQSYVLFCFEAYDKNPAHAAVRINNESNLFDKIGEHLLQITCFVNSFLMKAFR
jgi:hypothetical protein